jgi:hypothetical protein
MPTASLRPFAQHGNQGHEQAHAGDGQHHQHGHDHRVRFAGARPVGPARRIRIRIAQSQRIADGRRRGPVFVSQAGKNVGGWFPVGPSFAPDERVGGDASFRNPASHNIARSRPELSARGWANVPNGMGSFGNGIDSPGRRARSGHCRGGGRRNRGRASHRTRRERRGCRTGGDRSRRGRRGHRTCRRGCCCRQRLCRRRHLRLTRRQRCARFGRNHDFRAAMGTNPTFPGQERLHVQLLAATVAMKLDSHSGTAKGFWQTTRGQHGRGRQRSRKTLKTGCVATAYSSQTRPIFIIRSWHTL